MAYWIIPVLLLSVGTITESVKLNCFPVYSTCPGSFFHCECQTLGALVWTIGSSQDILFFASSCQDEQVVLSATQNILVVCRTDGRSRPIKFASSFNLTLQHILNITCRNASTIERHTLSLPSKRGL